VTDLSNGAAVFSVDVKSAGSQSAMC